MRRIHVSNTDSLPQTVVREIQGVPARGIVDTGSDITIVCGVLFKYVATVARLRKKNFKPPDKSPHSYNKQPFNLDGRMDLKISFGEKDMITPIYVKMAAADQLLFSEGVCRQLGSVYYHEDVCPRRVVQKKSVRRNDQSGQARVVGVVTEESSFSKGGQNDVKTSQSTQPATSTSTPASGRHMTDRTIPRGNTSVCRDVDVQADPINAQGGSQTPPDREVTEIETFLASVSMPAVVSSSTVTPDGGLPDIVSAVETESLPTALSKP